MLCGNMVGKARECEWTSTQFKIVKVYCNIQVKPKSNFQTFHQSNMNDIADVELGQKMANTGSAKFQLDEEKKEDENNSVPRSLLTFIETPKYYNFLLALLEYCRELFRLENKQQVLE